MVKNLLANAGNTRDAGSVRGLGRSAGEGNGTQVQYSCLENSIDRGAWRATVHGVAKSQTQLSTHTHNKIHKRETEQYKEFIIKETTFIKWFSF